MVISENKIPSDLPKLPAGWAFKALDQLVDLSRGISYGIVQPGSDTPDGVPIVRVNNLRNRGVVTDDVLRVKPAIAAKYKRTKLCGGEVLLSLVGTLGETAVAPLQLRGWNTARAVAVIPILEEPGPNWVELCLRSPLIRRYMRMWATTTVQATLNLRDVARLPIPLPPSMERMRIADVLRALDDKIELNRRMNETLEAVARVIFKSWFVDFDPLRANAEGRQPFGMDAATAALFPNSFVDSPLGKIPKGWKLTTLDEAIDIYDSKRIPLSGRERIQVKGTYPYYGAAGVVDHVNNYLFDGIFILIGEDGSVVNDDDTPVVQYVWGKFWVNNHAHVLQGCSGISNEHLLLFLQTVNIRPYVTGAVQPKLNQGNLCRIPFLLPDKEVCDAFGATVEPLYGLLRANTEQSRTLTTIRDALLPKLISGEIRVKNGEELVGGAVR